MAEKLCNLRKYGGGGSNAPIFIDANKYLTNSAIETYTDGTQLIYNADMIVNVVGKTNLYYVNSVGNATSMRGFKDGVMSSVVTVATGSNTDISTYDYIRLSGSGSGVCQYTIT